MKSRLFSVGLPTAFAVLWLMISPAYAQIQAVRSLHVYDANGTKVGKVFDASVAGVASAAFKAGGIPFFLVMSNGGDAYPAPFTGQAGILVFLEPGCHGVAYITPAPGPISWASVIAPNASVSLADPKAIATVLLPKSIRHNDGSCQAIGQSPLPLVPAVYVGDLIPRFVPPFTVR